MVDALSLTLKLFTMSKLELEAARDSTDNEKFKKLLQDTIDARFPNSK